MIRSISSGFNLASFKACLEASTAKSEVHTLELAILLFFIPVFVEIHSSLVSTCSIQSSLLISFGGTYAPNPIMPTDVIFYSMRDSYTFSLTLFYRRKVVLVYPSINTITKPNMKSKERFIHAWRHLETILYCPIH